MVDLNPILSLPMEVRMWIEAKLREPLTEKEVLALLNEKYPYISSVTARNLLSYRKKVVPQYQDLLLERYGKKAHQPESEIEEEILETVREAEEADEEFSKEESQKINMLKAHKRILKELYQNYKTVRTTTDETSKKNYLESMLKCLSSIREQEATEKDFLSTLADIRKVELKMTSEQYEDSIKGWWILRACEKCTSKEQSQKLLDNLKVYIDKLKDIIDKSENIEEVRKNALALLYVKKVVN